MSTSDLASDDSPAAPSLPVTRPRRAPGTTNAPGGRWHSTSNADRRAKAYRITLPARARAAQQAIADARHGGNLSEATAAALLAYAETLGLPVTDEQD